jgi:hypothetical protein
MRRFYCKEEYGERRLGYLGLYDRPVYRDPSHDLVADVVRDFIVVKTVPYNQNRDGWKVTEAHMGHTYLTAEEAKDILGLHPETDWQIFKRVPRPEPDCVVCNGTGCIGDEECGNCQ